MAMKNKEIVTLYNTLMSVKQYPHSKFMYAIAKNKAALKDSYESIMNGLDAVNKIKEDFEKDSDQLCRDYARKEGGEPVMKMGVDNALYWDIEDKKKFSAARLELEKKHEKTLAKHKKAMKGHEDLLEQEVEVKLYKIKYNPETDNGENIPKDCAEITNLMEIIEEA
jgi:hypothetical protein